jgi:type I site-specific restriction-modification system R (restriction) subunit
MTSHLGEKGGEWDEYYLTPEQREDEAERFKSPDNDTKLLIVIDMLLVGYDVPIVQVMYLDKSLKEHTLLQAIARVNRLYDTAKTYGLIVDYCGITKDLQKALAIFEEEDIKGALEPAEKELEELKNRHREAISFFKDMDREDNSAIIEKFEPVNVRDDFEYAFKMFSKSLDIILPKKEAEPYKEDFKYLSRFFSAFEFAVYELLESVKRDQKLSKNVTEKIFKKVSEETKLIGWKTKRSSEKKMKIDIYDILAEHKYPDKSIEVMIQKIIDLAKLHL